MRTVRSDTDLVRTYLKEMGRVPLLTQEQEVTYGRAVQALVGLEEIRAQLTNDLDHEPTLAEWARAANITADVLEATQHLGQRAKRKMVEANLRLVVSIAKKYIKTDVELLDLIQEGNIGLQRGVEKFDPAKGYRFSTYAYWWIRQAMTRAIAEKSRTVRLPIHINEKIGKIRKFQRQLAQDLGCPATVKEIADSVGLAPEKVREYLNYSRKTLSLDLRVGDNQDTEIGDLLEDEGPSPEDYAIRMLLRSDLAKMLKALTPQQQEVLALRFGLEDGEGLTLAKIGEHLNVTRERVRQIEKSALRHLRQEYGNAQEHLAAL